MDYRSKPVITADLITNTVFQIAIRRIKLILQNNNPVKEVQSLQKIMYSRTRTAIQNLYEVDEKTQYGTGLVVLYTKSLYVHEPRNFIYCKYIVFVAAVCLQLKEGWTDVLSY